MTDLVLLDTCALIWLGNGVALSRPATLALRQATSVFVSPISAWELGLLSRRQGTRSDSLQFLPDVRTWIDRFMARSSVRQAPFDAHIALDAATLPGDLHNDPADRLLVATARILNVAIVTRDRKILAYAETGNVRAVAC